jgi:ribosome-associated protein
MPPRQPSDPASDQPDAEPWDRPSKTQRKKESHGLQQLGEDLVEIPDDRLDGLPMDESLRDALRMYKQTRSHEGRRRQMQYVGKLMRRADPEPLREAVAALKLGTAKASLALHELEHWRAQMLAGDDVLTTWMEQHPATDLQQLRSLVRAARKDAAAAPEQRNGRAYRELFQLIKQHHGAASAEPARQVRDDEPND